MPCGCLALPKPAPGPECGIIPKGGGALGNRTWWEQLKSAFHGGVRRLHTMQWIPGEWREHAGCEVWLEAGFCHSTSSTRLVNHLHSSSRYKAKHLDRISLICNAEGFIQAIQRGIQQGLI